MMSEILTWASKILNFDIISFTLLTSIIEIRLSSQLNALRLFRNFFPRNLVRLLALPVNFFVVLVYLGVCGSTVALYALSIDEDAPN